VSKNTIKRYIEYLEASFLIRVMHRVDHNARRFKRDHTFKVYLTNSSIRTGLFASLEMQSDHLGHAVETAVIAQRFHQINEYLHYARWKAGREYRELDVVRMNGGMQLTHATEVKFTDRITKQPKSWEPWLDFCNKNSLDELTVTTRTVQEKKTVGRVKIHFEPTALYMYKLGINQ
jgi:predicted AAA+ superfamily ATPase